MAENRTKKEQKAAVSEKQKRRLPDGGGGIGARCVTGMGVARCCRNVVMCRSDSRYSVFRKIARFIGVRAGPPRFSPCLVF